MINTPTLFKRICPPKILATPDFIIGDQYRYDVINEFGNPETFVTVIFYDGTVISKYLVSDKGRIWSYEKNDFLSQATNEKNYCMVTLINIPTKTGIKSTYYTGVHRIELMSFFPITMADYYLSNHVDGNPSNNDLINLEWSTPSENTTHAIDMGLANCKCSNNARSYLTDIQVHLICKCLEEGHKPPYIADMIGHTVPNVTQDVRNRVCAIIRNIKYGDTYRDIADQYNFPGTGGVYRYPDEMAEILCKILNEGNFETYKDVADILGIPEKDRIRFRIYVDDILKGKTGTYYSRQYDHLKKPSSAQIV